MKKSHLWYLIPLIFACLFGHFTMENSITLSIISLSVTGYTFFIALSKNIKL